MVRSILEYVILAGSSLPRTKDSANSLHHCAILSTPRTPGPALGLVPGVAGFNSRARLCSTPALAGRATTSSVPRRGAAHVHSHTPDAPACTHTHPTIIFTDCDFACARLAPRPRSTRSIFAFVILAGSLFLRTFLVRDAVVWVCTCNTHGLGELQLPGELFYMSLQYTGSHMSQI